MNRKVRISLGTFIVLSVAGLVLMVILHYQTRNSIQVNIVEDKKIEVKIDRIHYSGTNDGKLEWEMEASSAKRSKDDDLTYLKTVKITHYPAKGAPYIMTADAATFREATGEISATGSVLVESKDGYRFSSQSVMYSLKTREMTTDDTVELRSDGLDLKGTGFHAEMASGRFRLFKNVKAVFRNKR